MRRLSTIPFLLGLHLVAIFMVLSCGSSRAPQQLTLRAQPGYSGPVHVATCMKGADTSIVELDARGFGNTSLCPSADQQVAVIIIRGRETIHIALPEVSISRTGDKIATSIEAELH